MAFDLNTPENSINSNKPKNGSFGKNDSHSFINPTVQTESTTKATTSSKSKELGYLHSSSIRDSGDTQSNHHFDHTNTPDLDHGALLNPELDTTFSSEGLSPRSRLRNLRNKIDLNTSQNSIPNENYNDMDPEETLTVTSDYNNDTTLGETMHSTPNSSNQYNHLGARPKTNSYTDLNTPQRSFKETFRFTTNKLKKHTELKNSNDDPQGKNRLNTKTLGLIM